MDSAALELELYNKVTDVIHGQHMKSCVMVLCAVLAECCIESAEKRGDADAVFQSAIDIFTGIFRQMAESSLVPSNATIN